MTRLTNKAVSGEWNVLGIPWKEVDRRLYGALCKLKDYEDTGLSPADVERLNDFDTSQAIKATAKLQAEQRKHQWIPVSVRLPVEPENALDDEDNIEWDNVTEYNVTIDGASESTSLYYVGGGHWTDTIYQLYQVIAWMPMPVVYVDEL